MTSASIKGLQGLKFVDKTVEGTPTLEEAREEVSWPACLLVIFIALPFPCHLCPGDVTLLEYTTSVLTYLMVSYQICLSGHARRLD